jgi:hypothetical protein
MLQEPSRTFQRGESMSRKFSKQRRILELAVGTEYLYYRREMRRVFEVFRKQGYGVRGYKVALERALFIVTKAVKAINILEG